MDSLTPSLRISQLKYHKSHKQHFSNVLHLSFDFRLFKQTAKTALNYKDYRTVMNNYAEGRRTNFFSSVTFVVHYFICVYLDAPLCDIEFMNIDLIDVLRVKSCNFRCFHRLAHMQHICCVHSAVRSTRTHQEMR